MFGSTFSFGFDVAAVVTQITGLLGNPLVLGLVTASIAVGWALRLTRFVKKVGTGGSAEGHDLPMASNDVIENRWGIRLKHMKRKWYRRDMNSPVNKSIRRHNRRHLHNLPF